MKQLPSPPLERSWVVGQVALSLLLVIGAGLFARTLANMYSVDSGFDRHGLLMCDVNLSKAGYKGDQIKTMQGRIVERLKALPGVESASYEGLVPLSGGGWNGDVRVEGYAPKPDENADAHLNAIGPGHFRTLRTPLLRRKLASWQASESGGSRGRRQGHKVSQYPAGVSAHCLLGLHPGRTVGGQLLCARTALRYE